ncbi:MAG: hypothetical protein LUH00_11315 [Lachnospiraceae bacterium]|nr:hypothetical protein [Lachnospiraceae bacterium]
MDDRLLQEFIRFAQEKYGCTIVIKESKDPNTFEKIFGTSFLDPAGDPINNEVMKIEYPDVRYSLNVTAEEQSVFDLLEENTQFLAA